jgi:hypothetical protein
MVVSALAVTEVRADERSAASHRHLSAMRPLLSFYVHVGDVEAAGGYPIDVVSVTTEDAIREIQEGICNYEL